MTIPGLPIKTTKKRTKPFTLIELFITLSILLLIGGVCSVRLSTLIKEHRLGVQTRNFERVLTKAYRMSHILDKDIQVDIEEREKGITVCVSHHDGAIHKLVREEKKYTAIANIQIGKDKTKHIRLVFSLQPKGKEVGTIKIVSGVIGSEKKRKMIPIKGFFIQKDKKTLTM